MLGSRRLLCTARLLLRLLHDHVLEDCVAVCRVIHGVCLVHVAGEHCP